MSHFFNIISDEEDFEPIKTLLSLFITSQKSICDDEIIIRMVSDAKLLSQDFSSIRTISRTTFNYSVFLESHGKDVISKITNPNQMTMDDCANLLDVFNQ